MPRFAFRPAPGLFSDETDFDSPGRIVDCSNLRPHNGRWEVIGGWESRGVSPGSVKSIFQFGTSNGGVQTAYGTANAIKLQSGGTLHDITPGVIANALWRFASWGDHLLALPTNDTLYEWQGDTGADAAAVAGAPAQITDFVVDPVRRQVLALGCSEEVSAAFNGRCIRWCDFGNLSSWTSEPDNNAGEQILDGATSNIVGGRMVGGFPVVWTSTELFLGIFIGDPGQTWRFERIAENCGLFAIRCVTVADDAAYWMTPDERFMMYRPGAEPVQLPCPVSARLNNAIGTAKETTPTEVFMSHVARFDEIWLSYPRSPAPHGYYAFSRADPRLWFRGVHRRVAMEQGTSRLVAVLATGTAVNCEVGQRGTAADHPLEWSIESAPHYLDEAERGVEVQGVWPDFKNQDGAVALQLITREFPQGDETFHDPVTLAAGADKADFRVSGRMVAVALSGNDGNGTTDTFMRLGRITFPFVVTGER